MSKNNQKSRDNIVSGSTFIINQDDEIEEHLVQVKKIGGARYIAIGKIRKEWIVGQLIHITVHKESGKLILKPFEK